VQLIWLATRSLIRYSVPSLVRANVRRVLDAGFCSVKLHEIELPAIRAAREEAGPDVKIMLDVNCAWTVNEARTRADELQQVRLKWLEEPIWSPENYDGLVQLRRTSNIPIAGGENVSTPMEFERLMGAGAVDFVQPSVAKMGGISELCKVFPIAAVRNVTLMPRTFNDGPGLLAAIHVTAALTRDDGRNDRMALLRSRSAALWRRDFPGRRSDPSATASRPGNRPGP
jgi:L-alanine-DL-glutamate epimerase-like enolase superfamily enzyme